MRMKAAAYKQYGDAAMMSLVLDALPKVAAEVAAPLSKVSLDDDDDDDDDDEIDDDDDDED